MAKLISEMNLAEVTLQILKEAVNIPDGLYARAQHLARAQLSALTSCRECMGTGGIGRLETCSFCKGTGKVKPC